MAKQGTYTGMLGWERYQLQEHDLSQERDR
jgi:hypothetical protein